MSPVADAPLAEIVETDSEVGSLRRVANAEQLIGIEVGPHLRSIHVVVAHANAIDEERRLAQVGGDRRPIEDGNAAKIDEVASALGKLLMIGNDFASAGIELLSLQIFEGHLVGGNRVSWLLHATGSQDGIGGGEVRLVELSNRAGLQTDQALILLAVVFGERREQTRH